MANAKLLRMLEDITMPACGSGHLEGLACLIAEQEVKSSSSKRVYLACILNVWFTT